MVDMKHTSFPVMRAVFPSNSSLEVAVSKLDYRSNENYGCEAEKRINSKRRRVQYFVADHKWKEEQLSCCIIVSGQ